MAAFADEFRSEKAIFRYRCGLISTKAIVLCHSSCVVHAHYSSRWIALRHGKSIPEPLCVPERNNIAIFLRERNQEDFPLPLWRFQDASPLRLDSEGGHGPDLVPLTLS